MQTVLIVGGARGIGRALGEVLSRRGAEVHVTTRTPQSLPFARSVQTLDLENEASIADAIRTLPVDRLDLVICTAGLLHDVDLQPEKRLEHVDSTHLARLFAVNATGPLLLAKHVMPLLEHSERTVFASLSARVGSISDNRLGGWYGYRASKSAQNMFTKTLAIEWSRRVRNAIVVGLHPGTVDTDLSAPFQRNIAPEQLFTAEQSATLLLTVLDGLSVKDSGTVFAWDGQPVPT